MAGLDCADCFAAPRASSAESRGAVAIHVADDRRNFFGLQMAHLLGRTKANSSMSALVALSLISSCGREWTRKNFYARPTRQNLTALNRQVLRKPASEVRETRDPRWPVTCSQATVRQDAGQRGQDACALR